MIEIGSNCVAQHVLAHALGLGYDQTKPNRGQYAQCKPEECQRLKPWVISNGTIDGNKTEFQTGTLNKHLKYHLIFQVNYTCF